MATILPRPKRSARAAPLLQVAERPVHAIPAPPLSVVVRPDALRSIAEFAGASPGRETGGPLIGTIQRSWEVENERLIVSILATLPPGPVLRAGPAHVGLGRGGDGERAASALRWWRAITGLDLRHLGDWHKHHSGSPGPSSGDELTAKRMSADAGTPVWLTAVSVAAIRENEEITFDGDVIRSARWWQAAQQVRSYRTTSRGGFVALRVRVDAEAIPRLPGLPWHVMDPVRFAAECRLLEQAGFRVGVEPWAGQVAGLAVRLHRAGSPLLKAITGPDYPVLPPVVLNARGRCVDIGDWSPARFLVDAVEGGS